MTGASVGLLLLAALLVRRGPSARRRLHRLVAAPRAARTVRGRGPEGAGALVRRLRPPSPTALEDRPLPVEAVAQDVSRLAVLLRAGLPPGGAWAHLVDVAGPGPGRAWEAAAGAAATGEPVAPALREALARRRRHDDAGAALGAVAAAWEVCERTGAPTAQLLSRLAGALREEADARDARETALAAPRATARLLLALPVLGLVLGHAVGADPLLVLVGTAPGRLAGLAGALLALTGWLWTRRLVRAATVPRAAVDVGPAGRAVPGSPR